jgi:hypothetical protein
MQQVAVSWHEAGYPVLPVIFQAKKHGEGTDKIPLVEYQRWKEGTATQTTANVAAMPWDRAQGVAILLWPTTDRIVVDCDGTGADKLLEEAGIVLPDTGVMHTPRGKHYHFTVPPGTPPPNPHAADRERRKIALLHATDEQGQPCKPAVDLLLNGIVVVAGPGYREDPEHPVDTGRLAEIPREVLRLARSGHGTGRGASDSSNGESDYASLLRGAPEPMRHGASVRLIGHLLPKLGPAETWAIMEDWCDRCTPPADKRKVRDNFEDILRREGAKRKRGNGTGKGDHRPDSFLPYKSGVGEETNFRPVKAADLLVQEPEPMDWVWEPFLAVGTLNLLVSYMKVGKSTFAYPLAIAIAQGKPFLGYPTTQGGVLILAVEEHPRDVKRRLRRFGLRTEDPVYVHQGRLDNSPETYKALRNFITANNVKVVILDTLPRFWSIANENDNAEVIREVSPLLELARETGAVVILLHHERKSGGEDGRSIRGGSALFAIVDQALTLDRRQGGEKTHRVLRTMGRYDETPAELVLELDGDEYRKLGVPQDLDRRAKEKKVWTSLSEEGRDVPTVAQKAGLPESETRKVLETLGDRIIREGMGRKGDPYTYRLGSPNSILTQPNPIGEETNIDPGGLPELAPVLDEAEAWEP